MDQGKQDKENICDQIKEKIAKRKGTTSIVSFYFIESSKNLTYLSQRSATNKEDEFQAAHKLASEKLFEVE